MSGNSGRGPHPYTLVAGLGASTTAASLLVIDDWALVWTGLALCLFGVKSRVSGFEWRPLLLVGFTVVCYLCIASYTQSAVPEVIWKVGFVVSFVANLGVLAFKGAT